MQAISQKRSSGSFVTKKVEKEELEEKVDGALLHVLEQRTEFPKVIAECVTVASHATEQALCECEVVARTYRPPSVDFDRLANDVREALNAKRKAEKCEARLNELKRLIEAAKERESLLREATQSGRYVPL
uniref:Uncharacterized protein n=1 Tax=Parascaris univalens TaxID=6257 RepID=A0A915BL20_PARUN